MATTLAATPWPPPAAPPSGASRSGPCRSAIRPRPEVLVERVEVPRRLKTGEPFDLVARLRSNVATAAKVKLYQNQFLIEQRDLQLKPGAQ